MNQLADTVLHIIHTWLDPVSIVFGIILAVPVFATWYTVTLGEKRRRRRWFREAMRQPGNRPGLLVIDLLPGKDVGVMVEQYRQQHEALKAMPRERMATIQRDTPLEAKDMPELVGDIRAAASRLMRQGVDTVHYFHAGPAVVAALAGAEFANGCRVLLYQYGAGGYRCFGPLQAAP